MAIRRDSFQENLTYLTHGFASWGKPPLIRFLRRVLKLLASTPVPAISITCEGNEPIGGLGFDWYTPGFGRRLNFRISSSHSKAGRRVTHPAQPCQIGREKACIAKRSTARGPSPGIAENTGDRYRKVTLLKFTSHLTTNGKSCCHDWPFLLNFGCATSATGMFVEAIQANDEPGFNSPLTSTLQNNFILLTVDLEL